MNGYVDGVFGLGSSSASNPGTSFAGNESIADVVCTAVISRLDEEFLIVKYLNYPTGLQRTASTCWQPRSGVTAANARSRSKRASEVTEWN